MKNAYCSIRSTITCLTLGFTTKTSAWMPCKLCHATGNARPHWLLMDSHRHLSRVSPQLEKSNTQHLRPSLAA